MATFTFGTGGPAAESQAHPASVAFGADHGEPVEPLQAAQPWFVARRPFWLALLATVLLSAAGGFAIYFIHKTTPATRHGSIGMNRDNAKANPGGAPPAELSGAAGSANSSASAPPAGTAVPLTSRPLSNPATSATDAAIAERTGSGIGTATSRVSAAPTLQWSGEKRVELANPARPGPAENSAREGVGSFAPRALDAPLKTGRVVSDGESASKTGSASKSSGSSGPAASKADAGKTAAAETGPASRSPRESSSSALTPAVPSNSGRRDSPANGNGSAASGNTVAPSPAPVARSEPSAPTRLKAAQDSQCAESNFFSRMVCDERVRLRFCRDRWNEHQDCVVNHTPRDI